MKIKCLSECQRLLMRGFQSRSILYSERCAYICLAPSQNSIVWRPKHVMFQPILNIFSDGITARVFAWTSPEETAVVYNKSLVVIYWYSEDLNKQFSSSLNRFLWRTPESQDSFCSSAATLARFFLVEIFWLADVCTLYRLLCVIGSEMNYPLSLKLHDPTLTNQ